ncbi:trypsin-like serine protease [Pinibacter soli]|uniref:Trypsin-like serine protease n=1 Tax=Pinibacter soli TaxID=3044211 RepID=A0ABT6RKE2_9BACT|nr:trypsin-like serine protease [Pinibacter soli]MDI3322364.1 trypsin-like serine protease [Pinibacter soli]
MNPGFVFAILVSLSTVGCSQEKTSAKQFDNIALVNKIDFNNPQFDKSQFGCAFLVQYGKDTFAITAKHLLKVMKTDEMKTVSLTNSVKSWSLYSPENKEEFVVCDKLVNENNSQSLDAKPAHDDDWLVFSINNNHSKVKPLQIRTTPLAAGEKLYAIGWTRKMEDGPQRVYEFEYYKTIGNRILLKNIIVPEQFCGLSGAPIVDEKGMAIGIASNGTIDPETKKKYFSPCALINLAAFLEDFELTKK